jgi:hypothetical protein
MTNNLRQIRYWVSTNPDEQAEFHHEWTFCVINKEREARRIKDKILTELAPAAEHVELSEGLIPKTEGLHYLAFDVLSQHGELRFDQRKRIYDVRGKFRLDRDLEGMSSKPDIWFPEEYIPRVLHLGY